jgi:hypothetical protein
MRVDQKRSVIIMPGLVPIDVATIDAAAMTAAIAAAERSGDMSPVWTLVGDLLAKAPGLPRDHVLAVVLFTFAMDAAESGDTATKRTCLQTMREHCSRKAIDQAVIAGLLGKAGRQGWLFATAYDELATRIERLPENHPARALFVLIERRREAVEI